MPRYNPKDKHTTRINICPCGILFVCVTYPKKRGRRVYQKVKFHSLACRIKYGLRKPKNMDDVTNYFTLKRG